MQRSDPAQRYQTPAEAAAALVPFMNLHLRRRLKRRLAAAVGTVALLAIALWVAANHWPARILLADSFEDPQQSRRNWSDASPTITNSRLQASLDYVDGQARLRNRGGLASWGHFPDPIALKFKWKWTEGKGIYSDILSVALRTAGGLRDQWPHGQGDGIQIDFSPPDGAVRFVDLLHSNEVGGVRNGIPLPQNEWLNISIVDDRQQISVYLNDSPEPILRGPAPHPSRHHRILFYNREPVFGIEKESLIDDVRIEAIKPRGGSSGAR